MKILNIYIDTSVIGGYYDSEFEEATKLLFEECKQGKYKIVISDLTESELIEAPEKVKSLFEEIDLEYERVDLTEEAIRLAKEYINNNIIGTTSMNDCLHIALATINNIDILVSWNFKHIVNVNRIRGFNSINIQQGYFPLEIRSPKDIIYDEE